MGTRPLSSEEILRLKKRLEEAKKRQLLVNHHVAKLEQELDAGTCWDLSREDFERIKREVAEIVQEDKERSRLLEIKWYGHEMTDEERRLSHLGVYPRRVDISGGVND